MAGVRFLTEARDFSLFHSVQTNLASIQPPIQWVMGALFPGVKWQGRETYRSPPSSREVKNGAAISPLPPYVFMARCLINYAHWKLALLPYLHLIPSMTGIRSWNIPFWNVLSVEIRDWNYEELVINDVLKYTKIISCTNRTDLKNIQKCSCKAKWIED
jgi:hypothetical protein